MPFKYGDAVVLIQKSPDGTLSRVNALVVASVTQPKDANPRTGLRGHKGLLPEGEYLDLLFPRSCPEGHVFKSRLPEDVMVPAYMQSGWKDGATSGWEPGPTKKALDDMTAGITILRQQLKDKDEELAKLKKK